MAVWKTDTFMNSNREHTIPCFCFSNSLTPLLSACEQSPRCYIYTYKTAMHDPLHVVSMIQTKQNAVCIGDFMVPKHFPITTLISRFLEV